MNPTKLLASVVCMAGALAVSTGTALAQNLLVDPSFEAPVFGQPDPIPVPGGAGGGWAAFQGSITTAAAHSGSQSVSLYDNTWNPSGVYQIVAASAGVSYTAGAWFDNIGAASGWGTPFLINMEFHDASGAQVGTTASTGWSAEMLNQWESLSTTGTAPAGTAYAYVYFMAMNSANLTGAGFSVDDASLVAAPEPSTLALLALGSLGVLIRRRR